MQPHEYSVIGHSRTSIGRYLGIGAGLFASVVAMIATAAFDALNALGVLETSSRVIIFPLNAAAFYLVGYFSFDRWIWKVPAVQKILGIPDLNGEWECTGETKDEAGAVKFHWTATVRITQTWEKIMVYLDTGQSRSRSKSASLIKEPGRGYVLMYSYRNDPRLGEPELRSHVGYCELDLSEDLTKAEGEYFNNKGRITFGRMRLVRKVRLNG